MFWWVYVLIQAALFVLAELLRPKPDLENAKPASLGDFQFPTATEDRVIPLLWGTVRQKGPNVIWYGDFVQEAIREEVKTGLFSSETITKGFRYHLGVQFALCRGPIDALRRVWIGDVEVYSSTAINAMAVASGGTGYRRGDILTLSGGTFETAARVRVEKASIVGVVTQIKIVEKGEYSVFPSGTNAATTGGASGSSGCTIAMTKGTEITHGQEVSIDCPELFGGDDLGNGGVRGALTLFAGTDSQSASPYLSSNEVLAVTSVAAGGSSYSVGDILTLTGGTFTRAAQAVVSAASSGVVTAVQLLDPGQYTAFPASPASTTVSPTGGTGCTLNFSVAGGFQSVNGVTPKYLRTAYLAPSVDPLYLGNSTSIKPWAFEIRRIPNPLALADPTVNTVDANPANVIVEVLTNQEWGLAESIADVDTATFAIHAATLKTEGNGFSMLLDRAMQASALIRLLEEQIDGVVFYNQLTGKWTMNLVRGGYDVNALPLISSSNMLELESYARGSWEDTTNQVSVKFNDRNDQYKDSSALAQDQASIDVLQGRVVIAEPNYPGIKNATLANSIAWRDLRGFSYPLAKATLIVDRSLYDVQPGQVLAWTYDIGGESFVRMPLRVLEVDYGELEDGRIRLSLVEDVFQTAAGSFADPDDTNWEPPTDNLQPFLYQVAMEAPRGIALRDPAGGGPYQDLLWAAARRRGAEVGFEIAQRNAVGATSGPFDPVGTVYSLALVGRLQSALGRGSAVPLTSLVIIPGPDAQTGLESAFSDTSDLVDLGTNLTHLLLVGTEFMLPTSAQTTGANVQLNGVYRGVLDSVQGSHLAGTAVYLLFVGAGISETAIPAGNNVDVKLVPFSRTDRLPDEEATAISLVMSNRTRRPYPPSRLSLDGTAWAASTSMEANGAGPETYAIDLSDVRRRDYRTTDEVAVLAADASTVFADFPAANTTVHKVDVRNDPAGANTLLLTTATFSGTQKDVRRIEILKATDGVLPTTLRFDVFANHLHESVSRDSLVPLRHDFSVTTALTGQFNFGALDTNDVSNVYTATTNGTYNFTLSSAFTAGNVEYRLNGGAFTTLIVAGLTTGSIVGVVATDTIEIRHASTDTGALKQLDMDAPGAGQDAYGILFV